MTCLVLVEVTKVRVQFIFFMFSVLAEASASFIVSLVTQRLVVLVRAPPVAPSILARCSGVSLASTSGGTIADMSVWLVNVVSQRPSLTSMRTGSTAQPANGVKNAITSKIGVFIRTLLMKASHK